MARIILVQYAVGNTIFGKKNFETYFHTIKSVVPNFRKSSGPLKCVRYGRLYNNNRKQVVIYSYCQWQTQCNCTVLEACNNEIWTNYTVCCGFAPKLSIDWLFTNDPAVLSCCSVIVATISMSDSRVCAPNHTKRI